MNTLVRVAVALAAALLGLGGFVAVQAATGPDDQQAAKREDGQSVLTTADDSPDDTPSPDDSPSPEGGVAVETDVPAVQDDSSAAVDDVSTRTRTGRDRVADVTVDGPDTDADDTSHDDAMDDRSGSNSGQG